MNYDMAIKIDLSFWDDEVPSRYNTDSCTHEYVNVSFMGIKLVCKHCDKEKTRVSSSGDFLD